MSQEYDIELWWTVKQTGEVVDVHAAEGWPDVDTKKAFREVVGLNFESLGECSTMAQIAGAEVLLLAKYNQGTGR